MGQHFIAPTTNAELHDTIPAVGRAMMSVCSLFCLAVVVLVIANAIRTRAFTWLHGIALVFANSIVLADAVVNAHPW